MRFIVTIFLALICSLHGGTTFTGTDTQYAYSANVGWLNFKADTTNGLIVGEYVCSGHIYSANVGWIHLGDGDPDNGIQYSNTGSDYGVNLVGDGKLRGMAYGANIGWISFEDQGDPRVNLRTGILTGAFYSANMGWIALSADNTLGTITNSIESAADTDADGIADAWEREQTGNLTTLAAATDMDGDGKSDVEEYQADSDPMDAGDSLRILSVRMTDQGSYKDYDLTWLASPRRYYNVYSSTDLINWTLLETLDAAPDTTRQDVFSPTGSQTFLRIEALRPME